MTPLALLAPDQRAVLELVLRQDRSYGELSELLGISERAVRERAEAALRALAGDPGDDAVDTGRITDWLLGQQPDRAAAATRERVAGTPAARAWAARAAERLREIGGDRVPAVPEDAGGAPARNGADPQPAPRPRPRAAAAPADAAPRSSRLGGALLIGAVAIVVAGFLAWFLLRGDDGTTAASTGGAATPAPTAAAGLQATGNDVLLKGVGTHADAEGLMRLFKAKGGGVQFAIGAQNVPDNAKGESYAVWLTRKGGRPRLLGFPQARVSDGVLTVGGPGKGDEDAFPRWFATYDRILITTETSAKPKRPGEVVLAGTLPHGQAGG